MKIVFALSALMLGFAFMTAGAAYAHPHNDDEEAEFEEFARRLQGEGKPCVKVLSIHRAGGDVVVVCQQTASRPSSSVIHTLKN